MAKKIREDLDGTVTVHIAGVATTLHPGDPVPRGADVDEALLAGADSGDDSDGPARRVDPLSDAERSGLASLGVPDADAEAVDPEFARGYLAGYQAGSSAAVGDAVAGAVAGPDDADLDAGVTVHGEPSEVDFDPSEHDVDGVLAELEKRSPAEQRAILAKESAGKGRVGVLQSKYADQG